jgi:translation initiation factor IF-3
VVKIMDYGKYKFEEAKAARGGQEETARHPHQGSEVPPGIDDHDFRFQDRHAREFLLEGQQGEGDDDVPRPADGPP